MKPDFLDEENIITTIDDTENGDTGLESDGITPLIVFSCIANNDVSHIKRNASHFLKVCLLERYNHKIIDSEYSQEKKVLVLITPKDEKSLFYPKSSWNGLRNALSTDSCNILVKKNEDLEVKQIFLKEPKDCNDSLELTNSYQEEFKKFIAPSRNNINLEEEILPFIKRFYIKKSLLIRNIDWDGKLPEATLEYTRDIIDRWLGENRDFLFSRSPDPIHQMMCFQGIKPDIPILLKKEEKTYEDIWEKINDPRKREYIPKLSVLGYYWKEDEAFCKGPHIVLYPKAIYESKANVPFNILFAKVLVHELAHALMDNSRNWPSTLEAKAMEESLANKVTLDVFENYAHEDLKYVRNYIDNWQSSIYKFGIWQDKIDAVWDYWRESTKQLTPKLEEWFNLCFSEDKIKIPIEDYTKGIYNKVFE